MDVQRALGASGPLALLLALVLMSADVPLVASTLQLGEGRLGDWTYQDRGDLLPDGVNRIWAASPGTGGVLLAVEGARGQAFLAAYEPSEPSLATPWTYLPLHYGRVATLAGVGDRYLLAGETVGTAPFLASFDASTRQVADLTGLLPPDVTRVALLLAGDGPYLAVLENATALQAALVDPVAPGLEPMAVDELAALQQVHHGTWNGTAFLLAGTGPGATPALVALRPSDGGYEDLSDLVPSNWVRVDRLAWTGDRLYLAGAETPFLSPQGAALALADPANGTTSSLTTGELRAHSQVEEIRWNGTALLLLPRQLQTRTLAVHDSANETLFFVHDLVPKDWVYLTMVPRDETIVLVGQGSDPGVGLLRPTVWSWDDRSRALERAYRALGDAASWNADFVLVGAREASPALGLVRTPGPLLEDRSQGLALPDVVFQGAVQAGSRLLVVGTSPAGGVLYAYNPDTGGVTNLTAQVPPGTTALYGAAWNGTLAAVLGVQDDLPVLLVVEGTEVRNRSASVRSYLTLATRAVPFDGRFLLLGLNDRGPAAVLFDPADGSFRYLGEGLARLYGPAALPLDGAWDGETLLVAGAGSGRSLLGAWDPENGRFHDLTRLLPEEVEAVLRVVWTGHEFLLVGVGSEGPFLGAYLPAMESVGDLTPLLPLSYGIVASVAAGPEGVLLTALDGDGRISWGLLVADRPTAGMLDFLRDLAGETTLLLILGLSVALSGVLGYLLGRRGGPTRAPEEDPYYAGP